MKPCNSPGCRTLVPGGVPRCERHALVHAAREAERKREYEKRRPPRRPRAVETWDPRWRKLRAAHLAANPICVGFGATRGRCDALATIGDHVVPERIAPERALDPTNVEGLCARCHGAKTSAADGGWGNAQKSGNRE